MCFLIRMSAKHLLGKKTTSYVPTLHLLGRMEFSIALLGILEASAFSNFCLKSMLAFCPSNPNSAEVLRSALSSCSWPPSVQTALHKCAWIWVPPGRTGWMPMTLPVRPALLQWGGIYQGCSLNCTWRGGQEVPSRYYAVLLNAASLADPTGAPDGQLCCKAE